MQNGRHFHVLAVLARLPLEFFRRYILKLGLLDGMRGFLWATFSAYSVLVKYMKLWALAAAKQITRFFPPGPVPLRSLDMIK